MTPTAKKLQKQWEKCGREANINSALYDVAWQRKRRKAQAALHYQRLCAIHEKHQKQKNRPAGTNPTPDEAKISSLV